MDVGSNWGRGLLTARVPRLTLGLLLGFGVGLGVSGCLANTEGLGKGTGKESGGCYEGLLCDDGLECVLGVCVPAEAEDEAEDDTMGEEDGDASGDSGGSTDEGSGESESTETTGTDTDGAEGETTTGDTTSTDDGGALCGDGLIEPPEVCDGTNLAGQDCAGLGYDAGVLACAPDCSSLDSSACVNDPQPGSGLYSQCLQDADCPGLSGCATYTEEGQVNPSDGFCTQLCSSNAQCSADVGGSATPLCNDSMNAFCQLDCSEGKTCPDGMECLELNVGTICL